MSQPTRPGRDTATDADVIVVGAGPGGSAAAHHLATAGLDVLLLEKSAFPREKVCGDGLTPRAVKQLVRMGIDTSEAAGWKHNEGLRIIGGGHTLEMPWPDLASYPPYGLVRPRSEFDELLFRNAQKRGVEGHEGVRVTGVELDPVNGSRVQAVDAAGAARTWQARFVVDASGRDTCLAGKLGTKEGVAAAARRLLEDPKVQKPRVLRFFREYFLYDRALEVFKDSKANPDHDARVLVEDTDRLVEYVLEQDRNVLCELLTTNRSFVAYKTAAATKRKQAEALAKFEENRKKDPARFKVQVLMIGAALAGVAGAFYAHYITYIVPEQFVPLVTFYVWMAMIMGGVGRISGAIVGAALLMLFLEGSRFLRDFVPGISEVEMASVRLGVVGLALILFTLYRPQGLMGDYTRR